MLPAPLRVRRLVALTIPVLLAAVASLAHAGSVTVTPASVEGHPGREVVLPVTARGAQGVGALQMDVVYDPATLDFEGVTAGPMLEGALVESRSSAPGRVRVAAAGGAAVSGDGTLFSLTFAARGASASRTPVTIERARAWAQADDLEMRVDVAAGEVRLVAPAAGGLPAWAPFAGLAAVGLVVLVVVRSRRRHMRAAG